MATANVSQIRVRCEQCSVVFLSLEQFAQHGCVTQNDELTHNEGDGQWHGAAVVGSSEQSVMIPVTVAGNGQIQHELGLQQQLGQTHQDAPLTDSDNFNSREDTKDYMNGQLYHWSKEATLLLIRLYQENEENFNNGRRKKKFVWQEINDVLKQQGYNYTWQQVENRWKTLTAAYRRTFYHNLTSQDRREWPFFKELSNIYGSRCKTTGCGNESASGNRFSKSKKDQSGRSFNGMQFGSMNNHRSGFGGALEYEELREWLLQYEKRHALKHKEQLEKMERMHMEKVQVLHELVGLMKSLKR